MLHRIVLTAVLSALTREAGVMEITEFAEAFYQKQQEPRRNEHGRHGSYKNDRNYHH